VSLQGLRNALQCAVLGVAVIAAKMIKTLPMKKRINPMTKPMNRRDILTGFGAGSLLSVGTLFGLGALDRETKAANDSPEENTGDCWQYAKIDPARAADVAYEIYPNGSCMYAAFRSIVATVADMRRFVAPASASMMMEFPFHMMGYGHAGIGATGSICGAINGATAVIGLFVRDAAQRDAMIQELCVYYEQTELPKYKPKDDQYPDMKTVVPESVLCHVSSTRWRKAANVPMFAPIRSDRCRRLTADIVAKTAELLNRYHADNACTFAPLTQPTVTCFDCHGRGGVRTDTIVKMNCASCHEHGETHVIEQINLVPPERRGTLQQILQQQ